jgi:hypothetical protein
VMLPSACMATCYHGYTVAASDYNEA